MIYTDIKKVIDTLNIENPEHRMIATHRLLAKIPTIAAMAYKYSVGQPFVYPQNKLNYADNFFIPLKSIIPIPTEIKRAETDDALRTKLREEFVKTYWSNSTAKIEDDIAEVLARGLVGNKMLRRLHLRVDGQEYFPISPAGWNVFSTALCDTSSVNSTYLSNHTVQEFWHVRHDYDEGFDVDEDNYIKVTKRS